MIGFLETASQVYLNVVEIVDKLGLPPVVSILVLGIATLIWISCYTNVLNLTDILDCMGWPHIISVFVLGTLIVSWFFCPRKKGRRNEINEGKENTSQEQKEITGKYSRNTIITQNVRDGNVVHSIGKHNTVNYYSPTLALPMISIDKERLQKRILAKVSAMEGRTPYPLKEILWESFPIIARQTRNVSRLVGEFGAAELLTEFEMQRINNGSGRRNIELLYEYASQKSRVGELLEAMCNTDNQHNFAAMNVAVEEFNY